MTSPPGFSACSKVFAHGKHLANKNASHSTSYAGLTRRRTDSSTAVILRCSPFFRASLEGWPQAPVPAAILRDAAGKRAALRMTAECVAERDGSLSDC